MVRLPSLAQRFGTLSLALLAASLVAGVAYPFVGDGLAPGLNIAAKGAGVGLLALAGLALPLRERGWLTAIMTAGALGDVLLALPGLFLVGAGAFAVGHVIAISFYLRNRRIDASAAERLAALALIGWGLAMPGLVSPPGTPVGMVMLYSVLLCGMAAALLLSRFSRLALAGALLFVVSDTLLIMRLGGRLVGGEWVHGLLVWMSYYLGQLLIFAGVAAGLARRTNQ
jgi:uncharacterized membrane protein YhhN